MDTTTIMTVNLLTVLVMMIIGWIISLVYRNVTIADALWGLGFVLIAWLTFLTAEGFSGRKLLIVVLVSLWGLRLSAHLTRRNWGQKEDPRYGRWRKKSGHRFWLVSLFKVFVLQALFLWAIALTVQWAQISRLPAGYTWLDIAGAGLWGIGFFFEAVGDRQLARFKADPANHGRIMDQGLWAYSRHPNYFGECLMWWGIFLIALATPFGAWTVVSPVLITAVLLKMTGIPLTEKTMAQTRPGYSAYTRRTNAFFPWFPKKNRRP